MKNKCRNVLAAKIYNVLGCSFKLEHLMVTSSFKPSCFELVANLYFLIVLSFIVKAVLKFYNQFNSLSKTVHDEFLVFECSDFRQLDSFFLFRKFRQDVLLLTLEFHLFNSTFLLTIWSENFCKEPLFSVTLRSSSNDADDTFCDVRFQSIIFN